MGKAAFIIVPIVIVICVLALLGGGGWIIKRLDAPLKPSKVERQNKNLSDDAAKIFQDMLIPRNINNMDILTDDSRKEITNWVNKYRKVNG